MSLVNLANVCSHLQNASLARLGLTSIPYTKWHLSLALLLQKQGFLSQVKLGGASPPASCFAPGPRDNHHVSNHPHGAAGRNPRSSEAALALTVRHGMTRTQLQGMGFTLEALDFAQEHSRRSLEDLEAQGWPQQVVRFIADVRAQIEALEEERRFDLESERFDQTSGRTETAEQAGRASEDREAELQLERLQEDVLKHLSPEQRQVYLRYSGMSQEELQQVRFDFDTLAAVAGKYALRTELDIKRGGITISAMGLEIPNQSVTLPRDAFEDPKMLDTEGVVTQENRASRRLWLGLKYYESSPVLSKAKMISKPTKRIMLSHRDLGRVVRGQQAGEVKPLTQIGEIMAVSTDKGIMEARECAERRIGGMPLCRVW
jgi:ribosomal protein S8